MEEEEEEEEEEDFEEDWSLLLLLLLLPRSGAFGGFGGCQLAEAGVLSIMSSPSRRRWDLDVIDGDRRVPPHSMLFITN